MDLDRATISYEGEEYSLREFTRNFPDNLRIEFASALVDSILFKHIVSDGTSTVAPGDTITFPFKGIEYSIKLPNEGN